MSASMAATEAAGDASRPAASLGRWPRSHLRTRWLDRGALGLPDVLFALACAVAVAVILYLGRYSTFFNDEWSFIAERSQWSLLDQLMRPHNEHWSLVPAVVYNALFSIVGLRSYLPYLILLMVAHVAAATAVYVLMRHHNGPLPALAGGTLLLFLGTGEDNLFWAFQMAFLGAAAAGAWAIVLLLTRPTRRAGVVAAVLLVVAVATSGTGLFFVLALAVMLVLDDGRRRQLWVLAPAVVLYLLWYVAYGSAAIAAHGDLLSLASLQQVPSFVVYGAGYAMGRITGWGEQVGLVLFVILGVATALHVSGHRPLRAAAVAGFAGLIAEYALTGIVRAHLGVIQSTSSRYVYIAAILVLMAAAGWIGTRFATFRVRPAFVLGAVAVLALGANVSALPGGRDAYRMRADVTRASIIVIDAYGATPGVAPGTGLYPIPPKGRLDEIRDRLGLPLQDALLPDAPAPDPTVLDAQLYGLVTDSVAVTTAPAFPSRALEPTVVTSTDLAISPLDDCLVLRATGADPQIELRIAGGESLAIQRSEVGEMRASLGLNAPPTEATSKLIPLSSHTIHLLSLPDIDEPRPWVIRVETPADASSTRICVVESAE
jgi:hypothetical protein